MSHSSLSGDRPLHFLPSALAWATNANAATALSMKAETYTWGVSSKAPMVVGGAPNSDASPFGAWGAHAASSESQDLASMQRQTEHHAQQVKETERRILQKVEETRQIGASTLTQATQPLGGRPKPRPRTDLVAEKIKTLGGAPAYGPQSSL